MQTNNSLEGLIDNAINFMKNNRTYYEYAHNGYACWYAWLLSQESECKKLNCNADGFNKKRCSFKYDEKVCLLYILRSDINRAKKIKNKDKIINKEKEYFCIGRTPMIYMSLEDFNPDVDETKENIKQRLQEVNFIIIDIDNFSYKIYDFKNNNIILENWRKLNDKKYCVSVFEIIHYEQGNITYKSHIGDIEKTHISTVKNGVHSQGKTDFFPKNDETKEILDYFWG